MILPGALTVTVGGVRLRQASTFSALDDDGFKLWGSVDSTAPRSYLDGATPMWSIVYCLPIGDHDVDYRYWSISGWQTEQSASTYFTAEELEAQVPAAWAKRKEIT